MHCSIPLSESLEYDSISFSDVSLYLNLTVNKNLKADQLWGS